MTAVNNTQANQAHDNEDDNRPNYIIKQYRIVRADDGWKTRKERIGVAWNSDKGLVCLRFNGVQIIEGDLHLYPTDGQ